jgi:hypothetical protein
MKYAGMKRFSVKLYAGGLYTQCPGTVAVVLHPDVIVCSNDRTLSMKQREFDQEMKGRTVYRTHTSGAITIRISREGDVLIETYLPKR